MYVLKFRGAGQGPRALVAELVAGELARAAGLPVPEIVLGELDPSLARTEPDPEIQDLIRASGGLNLGLDYLPGSLPFDPVVDAPGPVLAASIVWFDAFVSNVDRTARNTNLLMWHRQLWLIDHGAALYVHHGNDPFVDRAGDHFPMIRNHVLLPFADALSEAGHIMTERISADVVRRIVDSIPETWLGTHPAYPDTRQHRDAYENYLMHRLEQQQGFLKEADRARTQHI
jgi:hypothetical protein